MKDPIKELDNVLDRERLERALNSFKMDCLNNDDIDYVDVRLQYHPTEDILKLWHGLADYDTDHRGYWASSVITAKSDINIIVNDLVNELKDSIAC